MTFKEENNIIHSLISNLTVYLAKRHFHKNMIDCDPGEDLHSDIQKRVYTLNIIENTLQLQQNDILKKINAVKEIVQSHNEIKGNSYYVTESSQTVTCEECGNEISGNRKKKYCSNKCKTSAYRKRKASIK